MDISLLYVVVENIHGFSNGVSCGTQGKSVVTLWIGDIKFLNKLPHKQRWPPSMHREAETYTLILLQHEGTITINNLSDVYQLFMGYVADIFSRPFCIACS